MQVSVENVGKLERKLTVKFPAERFERSSAHVSRKWVVRSVSRVFARVRCRRP